MWRHLWKFGKSGQSSENMGENIQNLWQRKRKYEQEINQVKNIRWKRFLTRRTSHLGALCLSGSCYIIVDFICIMFYVIYCDMIMDYNIYIPDRHASYMDPTIRNIKWKNWIPLSPPPWNNLIIFNNLLSSKNRNPSCPKYPLNDKNM